MIEHCFLDMDGVLCDFITSVLTVHDRIDALETWPPGEFETHTVLGLSKSQFWKPLTAKGEDLWADFPAFDWVDNLVNLVSEFSSWTILTSPALAPACASGKLRWLQNQFGGRFRDFIISPRKALLARPGRVLIDDSDEQIERFNAADGIGILFPQPWNSAHDQTDDRLGWVRDHLLRAEKSRAAG